MPEKGPAFAGPGRGFYAKSAVPMFPCLRLARFMPLGHCSGTCVDDARGPALGVNFDRFMRRLTICWPQT